MCVTVQTPRTLAGKNAGYPMNQPFSLRPFTGTHHPDGKPFAACARGQSSALAQHAPAHTTDVSTNVSTAAGTDVARQDWDTLFRAVIARLLETAAELPPVVRGPGQNRAEGANDTAAAAHIRECVQSLEQLRRTAGHTHLLGADPRD